MKFIYGTRQDWATEKGFGEVEEKFKADKMIWEKKFTRYFELKNIKRIINDANSFSDTTVCAKEALKEKFNITDEEFKAIEAHFETTFTPLEEEHGVFKKYANLKLHTDVEPYEVVRVVSPTTIEIRAMKVERVPVKLNFEIGGFAGHCTNQHEQEWNITSNKNAEVVRIRKRKNGTWGKGSLNFYLSEAPHKFYAYNF